MLERRKNPISTAVSALDVRLGVLGWVSRELADISAYSVVSVSLLLSWIVWHTEEEFWLMIDFFFFFFSFPDAV